MSKGERDYLFFLEDMLESMHRIIDYTEDISFKEFQDSNLILDAVVRNLEIIGEAANNIPESIKKKYPKLPWRQMIGLRNFVVHEYFGIDYENIWKIITDDLPDNIQDLKEIIDNEKEV
jgi:uncharacterized protein with HEPN domain